MPLGRQSRCRLAPSNPLKAKVDGWGWKLWQALVGLTSPVSTHPKRQNPSRIQAQRVATWSAEPVPFSTFEPAKSKGGWVGLEALAGIGWVDVTALGSIVGHQPLEHACETAACKGWWPMNASVGTCTGWPKMRWCSHWTELARIRNGRTPAGFRPNGLPLGRQSRCHLAPSNPLKALKADGWGWKLWQALVGLTSPVSTHPKRQNPSRIPAQRSATWSAEPVPFSTFEPAKSKGGWVGLEALAGIGWVDVTALGSIVGHQPLEHACETAACKGWWPMNASVGTCTGWPKMRWCSHWTELARIRNGRAPAGFRPNGLPLGRQSRCHLAPSNPLKALKADGWGWKLWQALVGLTSPVSTHPKRQNPSRIPAQRGATWSAEPVPFSTFEPAKSKGGWVGLEALAGIGWVDVTALGSIVGHQPLEHACETAACKGWWPMNASVGTCTGWPKMQWCSHWTELARIQNGRTPAGFRPNGLPLGRQSRCHLAPSNPLKALKADGWGWKLWQALVGLTSPVSTHPKRQNPSRIQAQRGATWSAEPVPFSTFEPAKSKGGWVGLEALAGIGWVDVAGEHASETAEPQQDSGPTGCHLVGRAGAI